MCPRGPKGEVMTKRQFPDDHSWDVFWSRRHVAAVERVSFSKQRILRLLEPVMTPGGTALDAGCGSGFFSRVFSRRGMKVIAADYSQEALGLTREATGGEARLLQCDFLKDSLARTIPEEVDLVFSDGLLEHFDADQQRTMLQNFSSVLKPDGVVVTVVPNRWSPWQLIRPFLMPGIEEQPFELRRLIERHLDAGYTVFRSGGLNVLPFRYSPEFMGPYFGMLLYVFATKRL